jgi:hypothetical protein
MVKLIADYQARVASWYIRGGFEDEYGKWHSSGYKYKIDYWEVLNEPDSELNLTPAQYTLLYDAIVRAVKKVVPSMKFSAVALADPNKRADYFMYFLNPLNHQPNVPIDMISYHPYSAPESDEPFDAMQYSIFQQAEGFLTAARYIYELRNQLVPNAKINVSELGSILPAPIAPTLLSPIPKQYWNLAGAFWAYMYGNLAQLGVDVVGGAELIDYPGQLAASTLVDWDTGDPNARYWVLMLLHDNFGPGDKLIGHDPIDESRSPNPASRIYLQAFLKPDGKRKILLVNKREKPAELLVSGAAGGKVEIVDEFTTAKPKSSTIGSGVLRLNSFAVAVITLPSKDSK